MTPRCVLCGFPMQAPPMFGDQAHNDLMTCIRLLRAELDRYKPAQAPLDFVPEPDAEEAKESYEASV